RFATVLLGRFKSDQPASNLPVEERHFLGARQLDLIDQSRVSGKHPHAPSRAAPEHFTDCAVQAAPLLLLADPLAVGRVADQRAGRPLGRPEVAYVAHVKAQQMTDASRAGVGPGELNGIPPGVRADDGPFQPFADTAP